jgi:hypothetical protein
MGILKKRGCGLDSSSSGSDTMAGSCENGNEPYDSIQGTEFIDQLNNC